MGRRGPPRKPTAQLKARGSRLVGRNPGEPQPQRGKPTCPAWLDGNQRKTWRRLADLCDSMGVMTMVDGESLARYVVIWIRWRDVERKIKRAEDPGDQRAWSRIANNLLTQMLRLEQEFGLTPAARSRISVEAAAPQAERPKQKDKSRFFQVTTA